MIGKGISDYFISGQAIAGAVRRAKVSRDEGSLNTIFMATSLFMKLNRMAGADNIILTHCACSLRRD